MNPIDPIKFAKNRAYPFVEGQQQALDEGRITEAEWFENSNRTFTSLYLKTDNPRAQSGHSGDETQYRYTRMMILEAIHKNGTFLDVGCANGYLMESLHRWLQGSELQLEFYGLDFSEELIELAKKRLPSWQDRFYLGNALEWTPQLPFDFVYMIGLELAPVQRQETLLNRLMDHFLTKCGRLILGPVTEERESHEFELMVKPWGFKPGGFCMKSHLTQKNLAKKLFWFDKV